MAIASLVCSMRLISALSFQYLSSPAPADGSTTVTLRATCTSLLLFHAFLSPRTSLKGMLCVDSHLIWQGLLNRSSLAARTWNGEGDSKAADQGKWTRGPGWALGWLCCCALGDAVRWGGRDGVCRSSSEDSDSRRVACSDDASQMILRRSGS